MAKRMLIDASHPEETRVVVLSGNRLEEFDYESPSKQQLKGNIYLAKITRVEPSLQAAFVDYGGNRHGFLPFSEIHPDYYRIPIADRKALLAAEAQVDTETGGEELFEDEGENIEAAAGPDGRPERPERGAGPEAHPPVQGEVESSDADERGPEVDEEAADVEEVAAETGVDTVGGDEVEDAARRRAQLLRRYKIQEVIKRRQVILVQITKEERGTKGAALTTYLSLAGRYCVLMPNTARGGGISRKITNPSDRRRIKRILEGLDIPDGVAVIVRTAGAERTKAEIRRDYEYLLRLWDDIRSTTLTSKAPCLIYEEANLIKRSIRDLYQSDMDEILAEGDEGYKAAKAFMRSLMPSHAKKIKQYKDPTIPLFYRHQVESQIDAMHNPLVQLKSGGYIVMNMTEALVAIDVNSGKATRERHIEETAYKTNLEAAAEVARQLRLRDLAGLLVIDFIDMEEPRHNRAVERKLKEAMRSDRARIQLGRISHFGLLEMSRQRLRPSLHESSTGICQHCNGSGYIRTIGSVALHVLRGLEEMGIRRRGGTIVVSTPRAVAFHILNQLRGRLVEIEQRYDFAAQIIADDTLVAPDYAIERVGDGAARAETEEERPAEEGEKAERKRGRGRRRRKKAEEPAAAAESTAAEEAEEAAEEAVAEADEDTGEDKPKRRRRRGKRGGRRRSGRQREAAAAEAGDAQAGETEGQAAGGLEGEPADDGEADGAADLEAQSAAVVEPTARPGPEAADAADGAEPEREAEPEPEPEVEEDHEIAPVSPARVAGPLASEPAELAAAGGANDDAPPDSELDANGPASDSPPATGPADAQAGQVFGRPDRPEDPNRPKRRGWWQRWG